MVDDPIGGGEWYVEVTTHGGERTVKGTLTAYTGPASGTSGTLTVQPLDPETMEPSSEPAVTIDCDDVEELTIP